MSEIIKAQNLCHAVSTAEGPLNILSDINLSLSSGETLAITGPSGSGKSTLLGLLAGLDRPTSGKLWLAGEEITSMDEEDRARVRANHVGFVFQTFQLLPGLTALENVMLPAELAGLADAKDRATKFLEKVGLDKRLHHYPRQLSGGEQQRVAIARAFASEPAVLFADEPTGSLDAKNGERIADLLFNLNNETGTTLVLVTHESGLATRCQRQLRITAGEAQEVDAGELAVTGGVQQ
ncbi:ABC transporter ATP-binding protein [Biformimicrobium ophioploci]|uniref:ABC transporter ATP-binding protein n=1 Tax=Biformimicrobium ophioploci TaxID=3036711 RepID=A0ABQ6M019_9GAMM|nr:ABC transporter ATP-binding protein [Microbulbifer sp. NKW57]GMG87620.1 ABC transporter ATP-binding protein [Microbulbifer sp. NKW57]